MKREYVKDIKVGKKVLLKGWVYEIRDLAKLKFLLLRDSSGIVQCIIKDKELMNKISELSLESVVEVEGEVKKANVKAEYVRKDVEVSVSDFKIISKAEKLPIHVNEKTTSTDLSKRLDYRFLDLHRQKTQAIFRIQSTISMAFREYFVNRGHIEFQPPSIIGSSSEGGTELYKLKYFEKDAFLAQSPQLYKQMVACAMEKVVTITPVWRAEKHNTIRHLNESRQMDIEIAFADQMSIMKELELVVQYIVKKIIKEHKEDLEKIGVKLKVPKAHYLNYADAIKKVGGKIGDDFTPEQEKKLCEMYDGDIVFTHTWPSEQRGFYIMRKDEDANAKLTEGFDALYKGVETSSGGQRVHIPELLEKLLKKKGLNPKDFKSYIDSFRFGAPPHAGWSIGLERFTQTLLELNNIREAVLFPRDRDRLTP